MEFQNSTMNLLEINLIAAQQLKSPRTSKKMQTYAVSWINPSEKLKSRIDILGGEHPTWNDKFMFMVDNKVLNSLTSALVIQIYCVQRFTKDKLIGTTRVLLNNLYNCSNRYHEGMKGTFLPFQVRLPSGEPQGILNIGINILDGFAYEVMSELMKKTRSPALDYEKINRVCGSEKTRVCKSSGMGGFFSCLML